MSKILHATKKAFPPKTGEHGKCAVFTCSVCGNKFVRTMDGQSMCLTCMEKESHSGKHTN